jgi:hypothetical protein
MATLFLLTMVVMFVMFVFRIKAVNSRIVSPRYFKLNKGADIPDQLEALSQNFTNLLELPLLFYIICLAALILNQSIEYFTLYAWLYVALRYLHSFIHITYNHILHRLFVFAASCIVLITLWVKVVILIG